MNASYVILCTLCNLSRCWILNADPCDTVLASDYSVRLNKRTNLCAKS